MSTIYIIICNTGKGSIAGPPEVLFSLPLSSSSFPPPLLLVMSASLPSARSGNPYPRLEQTGITRKKVAITPAGLS